MRSAAAVVAMLLAAPAANAAIIDFDDMEAPALFQNAFALRDRYAAQGVLFGGNGAILSSIADFGVTGFSPPNMLAYGNLQTFRRRGVSMTADTIRFSAPQTSVSFDVGAGFSPLVLSVTGFDAGGAMVGMQAITLSPALQTLTLGGGLTRLELTLVGALEFDGFVLDNLVFDEGPAFIEAPAPAGFALFGLGAAMLLQRRRKV